MKMRTSKPEKGNKFYITKSKGGYSTCIQGNPTDKDCNVLANCVGYACGRFNEIIGTMKYPSLNCNAENFIERAKSIGLKISDKPVLGGIMVWQKGSLSSSDGAGHVAIVERLDNANQIYTSESGWKSKAFWNTTRTNNNGRWGQGSAYKFRGCIINPAVVDTKKYVQITASAGVWCRTGGFGFKYPKYKVIPKNTKCELLAKNVGKANGYNWDKIVYGNKTVYLPNKWNTYL